METLLPVLPHPHRSPQGTVGPPTVDTSSTGLVARGPALESPLIGVRLFQEHVVAADEGQQVLVDDVLVGQATSGLTLRRRQHLRGRQEGGSAGPETEAGPVGSKGVRNTLGTGQRAWDMSR